MFDRLRELVDADPSLVHARGGDGKTPLHCAHTVEMARYLLDRGADIDARCVDHESTPVQYLVREAPDVARLLVDRGAWFDIFAAVGLRDPVLVERCLREDPSALDHRTWHGMYTVAHDNTRPATREEIGDRRGDIYRWVFGHNVSAIDAAVMLGFDDIVDVAAAARVAGRSGCLPPARPAIAPRRRPLSMRSRASCRTLGSEQMRLIADRAHANDLRGRRADDRSRVRFARARRRRLGAASVGRLPRKRRHGPAAAARARRQSACRIRRTAARRSGSVSTGRCTAGAAVPAISRRRFSFSSTPASVQSRRSCRPGETTWMPCFGRISRSSADLQVCRQA